jgi:hypothetical protein
MQHVYACARRRACMHIRALFYSAMSGASVVSKPNVQKDLGVATTDKLIDATDKENTHNCTKDTGGTCSWASSCYGWRNAVCSNSKCVCGAGKCATATNYQSGKCISTSAPTRPSPLTSAARGSAVCTRNGRQAGGSNGRQQSDSGRSRRRPILAVEGHGAEE